MQNKHELKHIIKNEIRVFIFYAIFLSLLLFTFTIYRRILTNDFGNQQIEYGYSVIEALILAKVIMIGRGMGLGEKYSNKPLVIPVIYKTILFCILMLLVHTTGYILIKLFSGVELSNILHNLANHQINVMMAQMMAMFFVFIFFFSFQEVGRVLGEDELFKLFFKSRDN